MRLILLSAIAIWTTSCAAQKNRQVVVYEEPYLTGISFIDRNGLSETINNPERLEQYDNVDFFTAQPYQKVLHIFSRDVCGNIPSHIFSYHENGTLRQYLEIVNGRACGTYQEWHPNGALRISAKVIEGAGDIVENSQRSWIFDGTCEVWDENGTLIAQLSYNKGAQEGIAKYYHSILAPSISRSLAKTTRWKAFSKSIARTARCCSAATTI